VVIDNKLIVKDNQKYMKARKNMQKYNFFADPFRKYNMAYELIEKDQLIM